MPRIPSLTAPIWRPEKVGNVPFRSMLGAALCLLAMGCQTQAPPKRAEIREQALARITLPEAWKAGAQAGAISDNWLASFNDPQLDALVIEALAHNPDLRVTATRVEQAAQQVELAKSTMLPALNLFGTGGVNMGGGDALRILSLGVSWEIDLWGRLRYGQYAAQDNHASAQSDFEFARQSLAATLAKSWFAASETRLQRQIADESVMAAQQLLALAVKRQQVGAGTEQDIALARASLGTVQDNARQLRQAHEQAIRALELLLGRYPATDLKSRTDLAGMPSPVPAGMPLETLERRPDLIAAERRVAAAFNRVGEAKAAQLPRLNLNANIAALSSDILALREDFDNPTGGLGANLLAPIYLGGALRTQVEIRNIEQKQALADYARMAMRALGDVENALAAEATLAERETLLRHALADNQRALDLTQTGYRVGKTDLRAVLQQQLSVYAARLSLLRVRSEQLTQRVNLHLALGGSFETRPPQRAAEVRTP